MPTLPSEQDLYDEMETAVVSDPDTNLTDFSAGSALDVMAGTVATCARSIHRWMLRLTRTAFVSTADGGDLDFVISDRVDLPRITGESDDSYRARYYAYIQALGRGTRSAWSYFLENEVEGVNTSTYKIEEDLDGGVVTLTIQPLSGYTEAQIRANALALLDYWRILGGPAVAVETVP